MLTLIKSTAKMSKWKNFSQSISLFAVFAYLTNELTQRINILVEKVLHSMGLGFTLSLSYRKFLSILHNFFLTGLSRKDRYSVHIIIKNRNFCIKKHLKEYDCLDFVVVDKMTGH